MGHQENEKLTELSAAIDALNRGDRPDSKDQEIKELAEVALLLKQAGPPPAIMAGLVDGLSAELAAKKKRRRLWLTSGAAGTAAAALLVFVLAGGPSAPPPQSLSIPPSGSVVIESLPAPRQAPTDIAEQAAKADTAKAATAKDNAVAAKQPLPAAGNTPAVREAPPPVQDRPVAAAADNGQAEKRTMLAKMPEKAAARVAEKQAAPAAAYLVWPGRQPDEVTVDKETATVRQVYGRGDEAIVITQRTGLADVNAVKGKANSVTATIKDTVVTVEGNLPEDELRKIAQSLQ